MNTFPFRRFTLSLLVLLAAAATANAGANQDRKLPVFAVSNAPASTSNNDSAPGTAGKSQDEQQTDQVPVAADTDHEKKMQAQREERLKEFMNNYSAATETVVDQEAE